MTAQTLGPNDITSARIVTVQYLSSFSCVSTSISSFMLLVLRSTNSWTKNFSLGLLHHISTHAARVLNEERTHSSNITLWLCATLRGIMKTYDFHSGCNVQGVAPNVRLPACLPVLILRRGSAVDFCRGDTAPCWATVKQQLQPDFFRAVFCFCQRRQQLICVSCFLWNFLCNCAAASVMWPRCHSEV